MTILRRGPERGAVAVVVAISMLAMIGFVMLVVDVGGLLVLRRRMVSGADSSALAAAQYCANNELPNTADVTKIATDNARRTLRGGLDPLIPPGCGTSPRGRASVAWWGNQELYFAPILGFNKTDDVVGKATALWGPAGGAGLVPIAVSPGADLTFPCAVDPSEPCKFWFDNSNPQSQNASNWGFTSLDTSGNKPGWPTNLGQNGDNRSGCNQGGGRGELEDWLAGGGVEVNLVAPPNETPTFVCDISGNGGIAGEGDFFNELLLGLKGEEITFPVNDPNHFKTSTFAIIGFSTWEINEVYRGVEGWTVTSPSGECPSSAGLTITPALTPEEPTANLTELLNDCLDEHGSTLTPSPIVRVDGAVQGAGKYQYDSITHDITWKFPGSGGGKGKGGDGSVTISVSFPYAGTSSAGPCGEFPGAVPPGPGPNDFCIIATHNVTSDGFNPIEDPDAPDFGTRGVRLVE